MAGDLDGAYHILSQNLELFSSDPEVSYRSLLLMAEIRLLQGKFDAAHESAGRALRLFPRRGAGHRLRGEILLAKGDPQGALAEIRRAERLEPGDGRTAALKDRLQESASPVEQGSDEAGDLLADPTPEELQALQKLEETRPDENPVEETLTQYNEKPEISTIQNNTIEEDAAPVHIARLREQGKKLFEKGRHAESLVAFQEALDLAPENPFSRYLVGRALEKLGRTDEALENYRLAADATPKAGTYLGQILYARGAYEEAAAQFLKAADQAGAPGESCHNAAVSFERAGMTRSAIETYRRCVETNPDIWQAAHNLTLLLKRNGEREQALQVVQNAITHFETKSKEEQNDSQTDPTQTQDAATREDAYVPEGAAPTPTAEDPAKDTGDDPSRQTEEVPSPSPPVLQDADGDPPNPAPETGDDEANGPEIREPKKATPSPKDVLIWFLLQKADLLGEDIAVLERVMELDKANYAAVLRAGLKLAGHENSESRIRAKELFEKAIAQRPERQDAWLALSDLLEKEGRETEAESVCLRLLERDPENKGAHKRLARLYYGPLRRAEEARRHLKAFLGE